MLKVKYLLYTVKLKHQSLEILKAQYNPIKPLMGFRNLNKWTH